jgi:Protein of unknown function (DUF3224)
VTNHAKGTFEVKINPQTDSSGDPAVSRMSLDKQFQGDLEGTSKGQMLASGVVEGSGGYVAMEKVYATLQGREGAFLLQHSGTMDQGKFNLSVQVVPRSGTGQLAGLSGNMMIQIENGKHYYEFEYSLKEK